MLPRIEIPSAPPSSDAVSEMPDAAPARSGGADPTISSVVSPKTGPKPSEMTTDDRTMIARPSGPPTRVRIASPAAARASPEPMIHAGRTRWTIRGAMFEPTTNPIADGTDHRPGDER